jgi:hypothetical protein
MATSTASPRDAKQPLDPALAAIVNSRVSVNFPPPGFDPRAATDDELARFFLPPRPDRRTAPAAFRYWTWVMSPPLTFPPTPDNAEELFLTATARSRHRLINSPGLTEETSNNWSGGCVRPGDFNRMTEVHGTWTVPEPAVPANAPVQRYESCAWIGIDGHEPASRAMPQLGTHHDIAIDSGAPKPDLFAWWQWWRRDQPHLPHLIFNDIDIARDDVLAAILTVLADGVVSFVIKRTRSGLAVPFHCDPPTVTDDDARPLHLEGRTAEWIVERSSNVNEPHLPFQLADYGEVGFTECNAVSGRGASANEQQLQRARLIRMNVWDDPTQWGRLVSLPHRGSTAAQDSLAVEYISRAP